MAKKQAETPVETTVETGPASITTRFQVSNVQESSDSGTPQKRVTLSAITGEPLDGPNPNSSFASLPGDIYGVLQLAVTNPDCADFFESGKQYSIVIKEIVPETPQLT
jgi:hypothetical protein